MKRYMTTFALLALVTGCGNETPYVPIAADEPAVARHLQEALAFPDRVIVIASVDSVESRTPHAVPTSLGTLVFPRVLDIAVRVERTGQEGRVPSEFVAHQIPSDAQCGHLQGQPEERRCAMQHFLADPMAAGQRWQLVLAPEVDGWAIIGGREIPSNAPLDTALDDLAAL